MKAYKEMMKCVPAAGDKVMKRTDGVLDFRLLENSMVNGRKYLQIIHRTRGYYLEFEKDSYNSTTTTKTTWLKTGQGMWSQQFISSSFTFKRQLMFLLKYKFNNFANYLIIRRQSAPVSIATYTTPWSRFVQSICLLFTETPFWNALADVWLHSNISSGYKSAQGN